jgi:hypothetical protein
LLGRHSQVVAHSVALAVFPNSRVVNDLQVALDIGASALAVVSSHSCVVAFLNVQLHGRVVVLKSIANYVGVVAANLVDDNSFVLLHCIVGENIAGVVHVNITGDCLVHISLTIGHHLRVEHYLVIANCIRVSGLISINNHSRVPALHVIVSYSGVQ